MAIVVRGQNFGFAVQCEHGQGKVHEMRLQCGERTEGANSGHKFSVRAISASLVLIRVFPNDLERRARNRVTRAGFPIWLF